MRIGIPKEIKIREGRVSLTPFACSDLVSLGHEVFIEHSAGDMSGFSDVDYQTVGVTICADAAELYASAEAIIKVKEPIEQDLQHLREHHLLFSYLHLAPNPELTQRLNDIGLTAIAFETVETDDGRLPLLAPMSTIAGRLATQIGATLLHVPQGGKGLLLGGLASTERGRVVVLGAGNAGGHALVVAARNGAEVTVFDLNPQKLAMLHDRYDNVTALIPTTRQLHQHIREADLLVGAVLMPGHRAPALVPEDWVAEMQPGSVIVDIAVDQGGCIATTVPTDYNNPTYVKHDVVHFAVTNMPGAVPRSASQALSASLMPYVKLLAAGQLHSHTELARGINLEAGKVVHPALLG
ncbi:MAG: alanine dehydrogenase [Chromatiales bacterium]|jgi:alanine dehydrogenase